MGAERNGEMVQTPVQTAASREFHADWPSLSTLAATAARIMPSRLAHKPGEMCRDVRQRPGGAPDRPLVEP